MTIFASVSDGLALLVSGAAMGTAARALWFASQHRRTRPATASPTAPAGHPTAPAPGSPTVARPGPRATSGNGGGGQGRGNQTREQVRAFLADRAGQDWSLVQVSQGVGRSSATISYTLDKLVQAGEAELTSPKPRRYAITTSGATAHQHQPQRQAEQAAPAATDSAPATADRQPHTRPPASKPATASGNGASGSQARGDALREQIRGWLADRPGQSLSLVEISSGVGRRSATVSYALDKLISAGHIELTSPKPRRYAITPQGASAAHSQPALVPGPEPGPAVAAEPDSPGDGDLREEIRGHLASHPGEHLSLIDVAHGVGRPSATVNDQLQRLVEDGQVTLASDKPRRYTAPTPAANAPHPQAAGDEPHAATADPASTATRPGRRAPRAAKPATTAARKPASGRRSRTAPSAKGKAAAAGK
jgi:DNA-binding transcriptional regulator PaaX